MVSFVRQESNKHGQRALDDICAVAFWSSQGINLELKCSSTKGKRTPKVRLHKDVLFWKKVHRSCLLQKM
jgi:hypothetical protein